MSETNVLDGFWKAEDQPQAAAPAEAVPQPQPQPEQPQEPAQPVPAAEPAPQPEPPALDENVVKALDGRLEATLRERDKRQDAERRAQAAEAELQRYRAQQPPAQAPNIYDDPDGYTASVEQRLAAMQQQTRAEMSQRFTADKFGADKVEAAAQWFLDEVVARDPTAELRFRNDPDPFGMVVRQHHQHQLMSQLGDAPDLDHAFEKWAAERGFVKAGEPAVALAAASPQTPSQLAPRPRSIVGAPSAGGKDSIPVGPMAGFDDLLKR